RFDEESLGEQAFARPVGPHDADEELAALDLGEGDEIAARRPYRRAVTTAAEAADALDVAAVCVHDVELLRAAAVGVEDDLLAVRTIARRGIDRRAVGDSR